MLSYVGEMFEEMEVLDNHESTERNVEMEGGPNNEQQPAQQPGAALNISLGGGGDGVIGGQMIGIQGHYCSGKFGRKWMKNGLMRI